MKYQKMFFELVTILDLANLMNVFIISGPTINNKLKRTYILFVHRNIVGNLDFSGKFRISDVGKCPS